MALNRGGYGLHQSIWRLFPGSETVQKRDFIYHVIKREKIPEFYQKNILSEIRGKPPKSCFLTYL